MLVMRPALTACRASVTLGQRPPPLLLLLRPAVWHRSAGHSHYQNIKHKKARNDSARSTRNAKLVGRILAAARACGGDLGNPTLSQAIAQAKQANVTKASIEKALRAAQGPSGSGTAMEEVLYEGFVGPVAVLISVVTDNRSRAASQMRHVFNKYEGALGASGSVMFQFDKKGVIRGALQSTESIGVDEAMDLCIDGGAEDVDFVGPNDELLRATTEVENLSSLAGILRDAGVEVQSSEITFLPSIEVEMPNDTGRERLGRFLAAVDDLPETMRVWHNCARLDAVAENGGEEGGAGDAGDDTVPEEERPKS